jgi:hypothetical protein
MIKPVLVPPCFQLVGLKRFAQHLFFHRHSPSPLMLRFYEKGPSL